MDKVKVNYLLLLLNSITSCVFLSEHYQYNWCVAKNIKHLTLFDSPRAPGTQISYLVSHAPGSFPESAPFATTA